MNLPDLFTTLAALPLFQGIALGISTAVLLSLAYGIGRWSLSLPLLLAVFAMLGVVVGGLFPAYFGLVVWVTGLFVVGILALYYQQAGSQLPADPITPVTIIALVSAPLLLTAVSGLLAFWPPLQVGSTFEMTWLIFIFLSLSLWQIGRSRHPLPRTVGFLGGLAGLALWQAVRLDSPNVFVIWGVLTLAAAFVGPLVGQPSVSAEIHHEPS